MTPGSIPWLMRHELRLALRANKKPWLLLGFLTVAVVAVHVVAIPSSRALMQFGAQKNFTFDLGPVVPLLGGFFWFTLGMTVMNAIGRTLNALFVRNDLDLLFASPISPHRVLAVRAFAIVLVAVIPLAVFVLPFANVLAITVNPRWLSLYLLVLLVAVVGTIAAMPLCVALVRMVGVRRAQVLGQVVGILVGTSFAIGSQIGFGPKSAVREASRHDFYLHGDAPAWLRIGGEIVLAEPLPVLLWLLTACLLLLLLSRWFGSAFATIAATTTNSAARSGRPSVRGAIRFSDMSLPVLFLRKEWRLLLRNPALLLGVVSGPLVQMIPVAAIAFRREIGADAKISALWVFLVFVVGQLAGGIAWLAQSGEDAPDLIALAPVERRDVTRAKAIASLAPLLPLLLAASLVTAFASPDYGLAIFACGSAAAMSCALLNVWYIQPGDRKKFAARRKGHWAIGLAEMALSALWGWAAWKAVDHKFWTAAVAVMLAVGLLAVLRRK